MPYHPGNNSSAGTIVVIPNPAFSLGFPTGEITARKARFVSGASSALEEIDGLGGIKIFINNSSNTFAIHAELRKYIFNLDGVLSYNAGIFYHSGATAESSAELLLNNVAAFVADPNTTLLNGDVDHVASFATL